MTKLIVVKEMKKRQLTQQEIVDNTGKDLAILKKAQKNNEDYASLQLDGQWASMKVDKEDFEKDIARLEKSHANATSALERYNQDIESYEKNDIMSDKTKQIILKRFEFVLEARQNMVDELSKLIPSMMQAKKNKVMTRDGMYSACGYYVHPSYYKEFMQKNRESLKEWKEKLKIAKQYVSFIKKIKVNK